MVKTTSDENIDVSRDTKKESKGKIFGFSKD